MRCLRCVCVCVRWPSVCLCLSACKGSAVSFRVACTVACTMQGWHYTPQHHNATTQLSLAQLSTQLSLAHTQMNRQLANLTAGSAAGTRLEVRAQVGVHPPRNADAAQPADCSKTELSLAIYDSQGGLILAKSGGRDRPPARRNQIPVRNTPRIQATSLLFAEIRPQNRPRAVVQFPAPNDD